jgi:hypothetical protein
MKARILATKKWSVTDRMEIGANRTIGASSNWKRTEQESMKNTRLKMAKPKVASS